MRKVTIYATKNREQQVIETDVKTWGELKALISSDLNVGESRCVCKQTRATWDNNDIILPAEDFLVYIYPKQVKSGAEGKQDAYAPLTLAKLRKACQKKSISTNGDRISLNRRLRAYDKRHGIDSSDANAPKTSKANAKPTTIKVVNKPKKVKTKATATSTVTKVAEDADIVAEAENFDKVTPSGDLLVTNSDVNIRAVLLVTRNKFMNMFDEILEGIDSGDIKRDKVVLEEEATLIAQEMGIATQ